MSILGRHKNMCLAAAVGVPVAGCQTLAFALGIMVQAKILILLLLFVW